VMDIKNCAVCGSGSVELVRDRIDFSIGQRSTSIEADRFRCGSCGESFYTPEQADAAQTNAARQMREEDGLLPPDRIVAIRKQYGLTQIQLEQLLGVGPKTVVRWERGTVFQSRAIDELLRIIDRFPEVASYLAQRHGVKWIGKQRAAMSFSTIAMNIDELPLPNVVQFKKHQPSRLVPRSAAAFKVTEKTVELTSNVHDIPVEALQW
jgi:HTH-type transcriptional regulator / antitoxin MqsA